MPTATADPPGSPLVATPAPALASTPAPAPISTPAPARAVRPQGFFDRRWPVAVILASFPLVALPAAAAVLLSADGWGFWAYVWVFGTTHFVVTLAVYLRSDNLRHFASSPRNRVVFFLVPVGLFVGFDLYHALRVEAAFPVVGLVVLLGVRFADFNHFNRQSFGVLQLFKARAGRRPAAALKRTESLYFTTLTVLLFVTFLSGAACPLLQPGGPLTVAGVIDPVFPPLVPVAVAQPLWVGLFALAAGLFGMVAVGLRRGVGSPAAVGYLATQTAAALTAVAYFPLYLAALAVHYVEYHLLMAPRCFHTPVDPSSRVDRVFGAVRRRPVGFYAVVLLVAGLVTLFTQVGMGMMGVAPGADGRPVGFLALVALFDGLFVFHYFVEMFIWRFGDPHFRRELAGLYFAPTR